MVNAYSYPIHMEDDDATPSPEWVRPGVLSKPVTSCDDLLDYKFAYRDKNDGQVKVCKEDQTCWNRYCALAFARQECRDEYGWKLLPWNWIDGTPDVKVPPEQNNSPCSFFLDTQSFNGTGQAYLIHAIYELDSDIGVCWDWRDMRL